MTTKVKRVKPDKQNPRTYILKFRANKLMVLRIAQLCIKHNVQLSEMLRICVNNQYASELNNIDDNTPHQ